jgi:hypothetical protein
VAIDAVGVSKEHGMSPKLDDVAMMTNEELDQALYTIMRLNTPFLPTKYFLYTLWLLESMKRRGFEVDLYGGPKTEWWCYIYVDCPRLVVSRKWEGVSHVEDDSRKLGLQRAICEAALRALRARKAAKAKK